MRKYETIFISNSDLPEKKQKELFEKAQNIVTQQGGVVVNFDEWGNKKLAYVIKKKTHGFYVCMAYDGNGKVVDELERVFRLDDNIMKFMTILKQDHGNIDPEKQPDNKDLPAKTEVEAKTETEAETEAETETKSATEIE